MYLEAKCIEKDAHFNKVYHIYLNYVYVILYKRYNVYCTHIKLEFIVKIKM